MGEQIISTREVMTVETLRQQLATLPGDIPVRDYIKRAGLAITLLKTPQGEVLEVA